MDEIKLAKQAINGDEHAMAPEITIEQIIDFPPSNFVPINKILPINDVIQVKLQWDKSSIGNTEMRLSYRIVSKTGAMIRGINAQTGDLIYSLL